MTMFRMPIFTWNVLLTGVLVLLAFPVLAAALLALEADRKFGAHVFDPANGGALLWQHLFWFFGHPEVYIIALPFFGIVTEIFPVFSRKPVFGYIGLVAATIAIAGLSATVWAHHMFVTGAVLLPFFSFMTFLIAVPTGVKFFNWIGTMWKGSISLETPMLWSIGFLVTFLFGGLTGIILASPPMDFHVSDSYFVVAHFHYVIFGTVVFAMFSGFHFWWPKFTGKMLDERLGKITFWTLFVGFHGTFLVQHWLGAEGMPRRYADYLAADGFTALNTISTIASFVLGLSLLPFFYNVWKTAKYGKQIVEDDPWGYGRSLEWATSCPPPRHNFITLPRIRSESPAFDLRMTMFRMPIFTWNVLLTGVLVLLAFPVLAAALFALEADRKFGAHIFDSANGGALLWQHLFWFFGHPEVYIIALPFFGIISEVIPVFSRKPMFGYIGLIAATIAIAGLSVTVWAHHMYVTGGVLLPFFSFMTFLIAVPTGVKFFNWIGTMWKGSLSFETPMLWAVGFLITFTFGGLTGVILASPPMDFHVSDSYFVVAHFHYVIFGTVVFAMFSGFHFWWPKFTGKMLDERLGKITFWTLFVGFHGTFLVQHWLGAEGMPRRYADYLAADGFTALNTISTIASFVLGLSMLPFFYNVWKTAKYGKKIEVDDPWGYGRSLEWATSCPPPRHNFITLPRIRSESPAFDLHHPEIAALEQLEHHSESDKALAGGKEAGK
ncbi:cbb3-type cytochrome c oxidase subunit I, partial [Streptomyces sp. MT29]|nr:cbb3-type cytochrome c oxidase subunit I [Streptomyces sp. MT29]